MTYSREQVLKALKTITIEANRIAFSSEADVASQRSAAVILVQTKLAEEYIKEPPDRVDKGDTYGSLRTPRI